MVSCRWLVMAGVLVSGSVELPCLTCRDRGGLECGERRAWWQMQVPGRLCRPTHLHRIRGVLTSIPYTFPDSAQRCPVSHNLEAIRTAPQSDRCDLATVALLTMAVHTNPPPMMVTLPTPFARACAPKPGRTMASSSVSYQVPTPNLAETWYDAARDEQKRA